MNKILNKVIESRKGHYIHAIEVFEVNELMEVVQTIMNEFTEDKGYTIEDIKDFFNTISIYHLEDEELDEETNDINKDELYAFDIDNYIIETYE
jgi:hypothetical protein